jgi:hypothetical protein
MLAFVVIGAACTLALLVQGLVRLLRYWIPVFVMGFYLGLALYVAKHPRSFGLEVKKAAKMEQEILAALRGEVK